MEAVVDEEAHVAEDRDDAVQHRHAVHLGGASSDYHFAVRLNRLITGFRSYSVADFLEWQLGSDRPWSAPGLARGGTIILTVYDIHDSKTTV